MTEPRSAIAPDGVQLAWWSVGAGEPLLLLNGQGADHRMWDRLVPELSARHTVVALDPRGIGRSPMPEGPQYTTRDLANDAVAVLDDADVARAHVMGFSMGGRVAQWLAVDHPDRVGTLVLAGTSAGDRHGVPRAPELDALMAAAPTLAVRRARAALMYHPRFLASAMAHGDLYQPAKVPPDVQAQQLAASQAHDAWDELPTIAAPTLVVHGTDDELNPTANAPLLAQRIPGAALHLVEGGRHGFYDEFRDETLRVLLAFLRANPLPQ
ncbi:alpha/beta hydrolase [Angustibacter peucedani]